MLSLIDSGFMLFFLFIFCFWVMISRVCFEGCDLYVDNCNGDWLLSGLADKGIVSCD